jgi:hypothetical protein
MATAEFPPLFGPEDSRAARSRQITVSYSVLPARLSAEYAQLSDIIVNFCFPKTPGNLRFGIFRPYPANASPGTAGRLRVRVCRFDAKAPPEEGRREPGQFA